MYFGAVKTSCITFVLAFAGVLVHGSVRRAPLEDADLQLLKAVLPNVTQSGFLSVADSSNASLFYAYYEAQQPATQDTPLVLWLQGGPGCSSMFGNLFELGPFLANDSLGLEPNAGAWNRQFGLLFIDQPIGTGFSPTGTRDIPTDELAVAQDLYAGLQGFYSQYPDLQPRPLFITGESYAGKYVPAIGHFIVQAQMAAQDPAVPLSSLRAFSESARNLGPPLFKLAGLAIGNGLTAPVSQILKAADTAFFLGLIDLQQHAQALAQQLVIAQLAHTGQWEAAHRERSSLLSFLRRVSGVGTMFDVRRNTDYDAQDNVGRYLNQPAVRATPRPHPWSLIRIRVQAALGVSGGAQFVSCSDEVERALGPDVMQSAVDLIPEILQHVPLLLYQGQFDAQDGPATQEAWIPLLPWEGQHEWRQAPRYLWRPKLEAGKAADPLAASLQGELHSPEQGQGAVQSPVAGYWKHVGPLTQVVLRGCGHMVPHDAPESAQAMLEQWVLAVLQGAGQTELTAS